MKGAVNSIVLFSHLCPAFSSLSAFLHRLRDSALIPFRFVSICAHSWLKIIGPTARLYHRTRQSQSCRQTNGGRRMFGYVLNGVDLTTRKAGCKPALQTVDGSGAVRNAPPLSDLKSHQFEIFKTSRARHSVRAVVANPNASVGRHRPR